MKKPEKVGRNDPCPCGSGQKFKRCCESKERKMGSAGRATLVALLCAVIGAIVLGLTTSLRGPENSGPNRVWSVEHGHWHDVP